MAPKQQMRVDRDMIEGMLNFLCGKGSLEHGRGVESATERWQKLNCPTTTDSHDGVAEMGRCALFLHRGGAPMYSVNARNDDACTGDANLSSVSSEYCISLRLKMLHFF